MKNSNEIQDIFQKLENGVSDDLSRKESVWDKIEQRLDKKEEKTKVIPFPVWKISGIAASLLLLVGVGYFLLNDRNQIIPNENTNPVITTIEQPDSNSNSPVETENSAELIDSSQNNSTQIVKENNSFKSKENPIKPPQKFSLAFGNIVDSDGFPIADAEIFVRGNEDKTTFTDESGKFQIVARPGDVIVVVDPIGTSQDFSVYGEDLGNLKFGESLALSEAIITGNYVVETHKMQSGVSVVKSESLEGKPIKESRKKIKGNNPKNEVVLIKGADYTTDLYFTEKKPNMSIDQALAGKVSGLATSKNNGQPGNSNAITIRGVSSLSDQKDPLFVIDGIVIGNSSLNLIDPKQIESVIVLKDASATALYGSRGANGVIIIKTKNGISKKELRKIKRQNRKNKKDGLNQTFLPTNSVEISNEEYSSFVENKFENPAMNPLSTFSVDVDKAAYSNIRRFLNNGQTVPKDAVRIEEMINYFNYNYPQPTGKHPFSINTEYSDAPWNPGHKLLKIGLQGKNLATENLPNSNLVFLIDVSGSMSDENKLPLLKKSLELLVNNLRENDKVSIVVYAGAAGVVLEPTSGANKTTILEALGRLEAGGSTAGAAGIELAYQLAQENFIKNGNNRVILATDGDFNVGTSAVKDLETLIEEKRKTGILLTCLGYGMGNYKDNRMETLANKGNGNYAYIDNLQEANKFLVREFSGTLYTIAKDVKIQIEFNPKWVQSYRLIGYETRLLNDEDFANDAIDAGEIGAGHQVTALYEIVPVGTLSNYVEKIQDLKYSNYSANNSYQNELATIKFRYKQPDGDVSTEIVQPIQNNSILLKNASEDFKFATDVAWFGLKLRDSEYIQIKDKEKIIELGKESMKNDPEGYKSEFIRLVELVK